MAKPKFTVCLQVAGDHYTASGKNVIEALDKLNPPHLKARGLFVVTSDGKRAEQQMIPMQIKKLLVNTVFKQIFEKRMISTLR